MDLASNPKSTVTRVLSAFQVCFLMLCFPLSAGRGQIFKCKNKVAGRREISMDHVAKPTHYEPPRVRTYP